MVLVVGVLVFLLGPGTVGGFVGLILEGPNVSDSATAPAGLGQVTFDVDTSFVQRADRSKPILVSVAT